MRIILSYLFFLFTYFSFGQNHFEVFFDFNKDVPNEKSLREFNDFLNANSSIEINYISGYCDSIDDNLYNKQLAKRRINSILELLNEKSVSLNENIIINAIGEDFEQSKNQAKNRKVTIQFQEKTKTVSKIEALVETIIDTKIGTENKVELERISLFEKFEKAKIGDRIPIYNIHFQFNSENIYPASEPLLEELLFIMERNPKLVIKINGHICCNPNPNDTKLSYRRALKIFNYLKNNGIQQNRLAYVGIGSNQPIHPIPEKNEEERIVNRRVEIEIIRK